MSTKKKLLQAAAGTAASGGNLEVDDVFSAFAYEGNGSTKAIVNNIDLSGEGGLVWTKRRNDLTDHMFVDTVRGATKYVRSNDQGGEGTISTSITSFASDGYNLGSYSWWNANGGAFISWTWRQRENWFAIKQYTGNGTARTISHSLGSVPGCILIKKTSGSQNWCVYHRGMNEGTNPEDYYMRLNQNIAQGYDTNQWNSTAPTSTEFSVGTDTDTNANGETYIAYLFAHHANDGSQTGFGEDGDEPVIACGTYDGNGNSTTGVSVDVGFEPQWLMVKRYDSDPEGLQVYHSWVIQDYIRGLNFPEYDDSHGHLNMLFADRADAEGNRGGGATAQDDTEFMIHSNGFSTVNSKVEFNRSNGHYLYVAIRRPMKEPTAASEVFDDTYGQTYSVPTGFPVDFNINKDASSGAPYVITRAIGNHRYTETNSSSVEADAANPIWFNANDASTQINIGTGWWAGETDIISLSWKRAKKYFDITQHDGTGVAKTVPHQLQKVPEMIWTKARDRATVWYVYHKDIGATNFLKLGGTQASTAWSGAWNDTTPTSSVFSVGANSNPTNQSGHIYISALFTSLDGISKCGSYTGNGSTQNIDCGFSNGSALIIIKRTDTTEGWKVHTSARGIVTGNDPFFELNNGNAENSSFDLVDPYTSGFTVNNYAGWNASGGTYIFYAVAA